VRIAGAVKKAILAALGEKDPTAEPCLDTDGNPEPDPDLRDYENVPMKEDIRVYFEREVQPHAPDAWISEVPRDCDKKDRGVGKVGYEVSFNRYFYEYVPPRSLAEIDLDIRALETEILVLLREVAD
jgi:type I restriction enzyme M protein